MAKKAKPSEKPSTKRAAAVKQAVKAAKVVTKRVAPERDVPKAKRLKAELLAATAPPVQQPLPMVVKDAKPNLEQLTDAAVRNLASFRKELEAEMNRQYENKLWGEVVRLAKDAGVRISMVNVPPAMKVTFQ